MTCSLVEELHRHLQNTRDLVQAGTTGHGWCDPSFAVLGLFLSIRRPPPGFAHLGRNCTTRPARGPALRACAISQQARPHGSEALAPCLDDRPPRRAGAARPGTSTTAGPDPRSS